MITARAHTPGEGFRNRSAAQRRILFSGRFTPFGCPFRIGVVSLIHRQLSVALPRVYHPTGQGGEALVAARSGRHIRRWRRRSRLWPYLGFSGRRSLNRRCLHTLLLTSTTTQRKADNEKQQYEPNYSLFHGISLVGLFISNLIGSMANDQTSRLRKGVSTLFDELQLS